MFSHDVDLHFVVDQCRKPIHLGSLPCDGIEFLTVQPGNPRVLQHSVLNQYAGGHPLVGVSGQVLHENLVDLLQVVIREEVEDVGLLIADVVGARVHQVSDGQRQNFHTI